MKNFIQDDGELLSVDLHGLILDKAEEIVRKSIHEAYYRGRDRIKFIHGSSTSALLFENKTIKFRVYTILQEPALQKMLSIAALKPDYEIDRSPISSLDIY